MRSVEFAVTVKCILSVFILAWCIWSFSINIFMVVWLTDLWTKHAVRSCPYFVKHTCGICWWLSRSNRRHTWFFWVRYLHIINKVLVLRISLDSCEVTLFIFLCISRLDSVMCLGVSAGAYILTLFAVCISSKLVCSLLFAQLLSNLSSLLQTKYRERVLGLILVSPLCKAPSWSEWFYNKVVIRYFASKNLPSE